MTTLIDRVDLVAAIESGTVTILDALGGEYYAKQHLPGALPLTADAVAAEAAALLPDRDALIVTYCSNAACGNSQDVANRLERLGYTNVRKYRDGIEDWAGAGLPLESGTAAARG